MDSPMSDLHFTLMSLLFSLRDLIQPPNNILMETKMLPGFHILDYGCGPGSFSIAAAQIVGESGKVYALDIHPAAISKVRKSASKKGLANIVTLCADSPSRLESESIDVVLLYDTFHDLSDQDGILGELHRILKPDSMLSFSDHHMREQEILSALTKNELFKLSGKGKRTYSFLKIVKNG